MSTISAAAVKTLRERTNQPMMACKEALTEAGGDMDKAIEILRKRGKGVAVKKGERETAEGRIVTFLDPGRKVGAIVEVRCESAPVAKSEPFVALGNDLARQVALKEPASVEALTAQPLVAEPGKTVGDRLHDVIGLLGENMRPARFTRLTGLLGSYTHHDGTVGVLFQVEGTPADPEAAKQLLKDVCMHIAAHNPVAARRDEVPTEVVEKEREIAKAQAATTGKPANVVEKIAEGKLNTWFAENVLEEQPFVKDPAKKVGQLLKSAGLKPVRFVRYKVGELS
jgi:elongation factor Ts